MLKLKTKTRKCGRKSKGAVYLVGGTPSKEGASPVFTLITPPVPYQVKQHRSWRLVDDYALLLRMPMEEWWVGSSGIAEEKKRGNEYWKDLFGLPIEKRKDHGVCANVRDADEILATLAGRVKWNDKLVSLFRELTKKSAQNLPNAALHFDRLRTSLVEYVDQRSVDALVNIQARVWDIGSVVPKKQRNSVLPVLERMLVLMDLAEDALYMDYLYNQK